MQFVEPGVHTKRLASAYFSKPTYFVHDALDSRQLFSRIAKTQKCSQRCKELVVKRNICESGSSGFFPIPSNEETTAKPTVRTFSSFFSGECTTHS